MNAAADGLDVLVPVFDGHDALVRCLTSLRRHVAPPHRVLLLDDASPDPRILPLLREAAAQAPHFEVHPAPENRGFVGNVNRGLALARGDVVLLNADTVVTAGWLERLVRCRDADPRIGIVCPLSSNATLLTVPEVLEVAAAGPLDADAVAGAIAAAAERSYPRIPTAVGSCMLVTRAALAAVGPLDAAFAPGYGEENDFSMRARQAGFEIACADDAYIEHAGGTSFGAVPGIAERRARNARLLAARWPGYEAEVRAYLRENPLRGVLERARAAVERAAGPQRVRVLQVTNRFEAFGGIEEHVRMLVNGLRESHAFTILDATSQPAAWADATSSRVTPTVRLLRYRAENGEPGPVFFGGPARLAAGRIESFFDRVLAGGGIDLVHLQSLMPWGSLQFAAIAKARGVPVILSLHDFFVLCPDYNMLLHSRAPCGRVRAEAADPECPGCLHARQWPDAPKFPVGAMGGYLTQRNAAVDRLLAASDAVVVPSQFLARRIEAAHGPALAGKLAVIPHGIEGGTRALPPVPGGRLRIAFVGRFNDRKGAGPLVAAARRLRELPVDFEVLGHVDQQMEKIAREAGLRLRGPYAAPHLARELDGVDLVLIPTLMEETFSLVLSEVQAAGVPFAASALGAVVERVEHGRTGFLLPAGDVEALVAFITALAQDRTPLERVRRELANRPVRSAAQCAADYAALYARVLAGRRPAATPPVAPAPVSSVSPQGVGTAEYARWRALEGGRTAENVQALPGGWFVAPGPGETIDPRFATVLEAALASHPGAVFAYADEDHVSTRGERYAPVFKTAWDGAAPVAWMPGTAVAFRRDAALAEGGLAASTVAAKAALARRLAARHGVACALHLPHVLGSRSDLPADAVTPAPVPAGRPFPAFAVALARHRGFDACLRLLAALLDLRGNAPWGIVVPFAPAESEAALRAFQCTEPLPGVVACGFDGLAPRGAALQAALQAAPAEVVVFLRDDVALSKHGSWEALLAAFADPAVAAAGGALRQGEDDAAGGVREPAWALGFGADGVAASQLDGEPSPAFDQPLLRGIARRVSALSPRCFALRREAALAAGGFDSRVPLIRHGLTDLLLRLSQRGHAIVATPQVAARALDEGDIEGAAIWNDAATLEDEAAWMIRRHRPALRADPWFPRALSRGRTGFVPETEIVAPPGWKDEGAPRIVAAPFDAWGSGEYRVRAPLAALERAGRIRALVLPTHETGRTPNALEMLELAPDGVLAHAFLHDYQLAAARAWRRHLRVPMVFGLDDLLTAIPPWNPFHATLYRDIAARLAHALSIFDRVAVSTQPIAEALRALNPDIRVIPNAIDLDRWNGLAMAPPQSGRLRVGWAGAKQHRGDLLWLQPVLEATRRDVDWIFLGDCPDELRPHVAEFHPMVPTARYPETLAGLALDLAIAPLADHPFNHAKSNLKLLEFGILGVPVIASDITPYRDAPVTRLPNAPAPWVEAVRERCGQREALQAEGARLQTWVLRGHALSHRHAAWEEVFRP